MAVAFDEGFSIREYTAKMRAVDVGKCWPFGASGGGEDPDENEISEQRLEALLPPITVTKFRWWSHELSKIQQQQQQGVAGIPGNEAKEEDEEKLEIVCPVCGNFAAATLKAVNAHVDSCLAHAQREDRRNMRMSLKAKSKSPKKRSIIEIFAVSPQIERVVDDDAIAHDDDFPHAHDDGDLDVLKTKHDEQKRKKVNINKKKIKKAAIANKLMLDQKKKKLKKKKMKNKKGPITNKGSPMMLKLPISVDCSTKAYKSFCNKGVAKDILDGVSIQRNRLGLKGSIQKKHGVQASKFIAKHRKAAIHVRGILKSNMKLIPQQNSEICNLPGGSQTNCCELQHSDRHVRFSGKDDILGPRKRNLSSNVQNMFGTYRDALASQLEDDHSSENDKQSASVRVNGTSDVSVSTGNGSVRQTKISNNQLPGIHDPVGMPNFLSPYQGKEQHTSDRSPPSQVIIRDDNLHIFDQGYQTAPQNPTYAGILRLLPTMNEAKNLHVNSQLCGNVTMASNPRGKLVDYFEDHKDGFAAGGLLASTRASMQPPSCDFASFDSAITRVSFLPQSSIKGISGQSLQCQPFFHLSPMEFMNSGCQQGVGALSEKCDGEFCGLPLNSHGQLMQVSSSGNVGFQQPKKSTLITASRSSPRNSVVPGSLGNFVSEKHPIEQAVAKGQLNLLPIPKNHNVQFPARFCVNELPNTGRLDVHLLNSEGRTNNSVHPSDSRPSLMNISLNQWGQYGQNQNQKGTQMIHLKENSDNIALETARPTMRLMGKDVAIGRSNIEMQGFDDEKIWTDKEIIQECRPASIVLDNSLHNRRIQQDRVLFPALGKSEESLLYPLEAENQASQSNFWVKVSESRSHPYFNWKTNAAFQNGHLSVNRIASSQMHPSACPSSPRDMICKGANFQESLLSGAETVSISSQLPIPSSSLETHPCMGGIPAKINCRQNLPHTRKSAFGFPFLRPDCNKRVQSSSFASSSRNLPPGLTTIQVKPATMPSQTLPDVGGKHHHCNTTGTDFLTALHHSSAVSHSHSSIVSNPHLKSSFGSALFVQPPFFPFSAGINPNFSMNMSYGNNINVGERMKSNTFGINLPDHYQKIRKRPAATADDLLRSTKMPRPICEDSNAATELARGKSSSEIWHNAGAHQPNSNGNKAIEVGCGPNEAEKEGLGTSHDVDSCKADGMVKSGPIKLTAGAKHVLKPSGNMDQDNSRLMHSTIPFAAVTDCDSFLDSQKKSMIYRF
ncbi:hypothetical protein GH714_033691 [Hevea brasiliensis]|uniref:UBZ4-type domain-containing protein n=1 Tax=Hevea brasiliensis TaxID=3981 RepID=A0A6A6LL92_HEVBR|nr:hypothetical protein GH714_033691 [Hevea brasiliensis]